MIRVAATAERYEDMCIIFKKIIEEGSELTLEERNLFSVAYKNNVGSRRASLRTINENEASNDDQKQLMKTYRKRIEKEFDSICHEVIILLEDYLIPKNVNKNNESEVYYIKM